MKNPFLIDEQRYKYYLYWNAADDGEDDDIGLCVGDPNYEYLKKPDPHKDKDEWEIKVVYEAVSKLEPERDSTGFFWERRSDVIKAMRVARAALSQDRPMPDWAIKASAAGWKPPKGWKP